VIERTITLTYMIITYNLNKMSVVFISYVTDGTYSSMELLSHL